MRDERVWQTGVEEHFQIVCRKRTSSHCFIAGCPSCIHAHRDVFKEITDRSCFQHDTWNNAAAGGPSSNFAELKCWLFSLFFNFLVLEESCEKSPNTFFKSSISANTWSNSGCDDSTWRSAALFSDAFFHAFDQCSDSLCMSATAVDTLMPSKNPSASETLDEVLHCRTVKAQDQKLEAFGQETQLAFKDVFSQFGDLNVF